MNPQTITVMYTLLYFRINTYHVIGPNTPFGGYKMSGIGREYGLEGMKAYCEIKTVICKL